MADYNVFHEGGGKSSFRQEGNAVGSADTNYLSLESLGPIAFYGDSDDDGSSGSAIYQFHTDREPAAHSGSLAVVSILKAGNVVVGNGSDAGPLTSLFDGKLVVQGGASEDSITAKTDSGTANAVAGVFHQSSSSPGAPCLMAQTVSSSSGDEIISARRGVSNTTGVGGTTVFKVNADGRTTVSDGGSTQPLSSLFNGRMVVESGSSENGLIVKTSSGSASTAGLFHQSLSSSDTPPVRSQTASTTSSHLLYTGISGASNTTGAGGTTNFSVAVSGAVNLTGTTPDITYEDSSSGDAFKLGNNNGSFRLRNNTDARTDLTIDGSGRCLVGYSSNQSSDALQVNGDAAKSSGGTTWATISDEREKDIQGSAQGALDKLTRLNGVRFKWKTPENHGGDISTQYGLLAQEVEKVIPEWVGTREDGIKTFHPVGLEAVFVEALKELRDEVKELKAKLEEVASEPAVGSEETPEPVKLGDEPTEPMGITEKQDG